MDEPVTTDNAEDLGEPVDLQWELYFGLVRAIGTPLMQVCRSLEDSLHVAGFEVRQIRLADQLWKTAASSTLAGKRGTYEYYDTFMSAADTARAASGHPEILAVLATEAVEATREEARRSAAKNGRRGVAYVFRSLMHPAEVSVLRELYRTQFFRVSVFSPEGNRRDHLADQLSRHDGRARPQEYRTQASELIDREQGLDDPSSRRATDELKSSRMNIQKTFQLADLFVTLPTAKSEIHRLVELIFSNPHITPTVQESSMAYAYGAATASGTWPARSELQSATSSATYWPLGPTTYRGPAVESDRVPLEPNHSDMAEQITADTSDTIRRALLVDFVRRIVTETFWMDHLIAESSEDGRPQLEQIREFLKSALSEGLIDFQMIATDLVRSPLIAEAQMFDVLEYSRTLHAEMHAITTAARLGISIKGATLYTTTLPCHECARLIVGAGIDEVIFVEPYGKSRVSQLYSTEISMGTERFTVRNDTIPFRPFIGVSPLRTTELFSWVDRKADDSLSAELAR